MPINATSRTIEASLHQIEEAAMLREQIERYQRLSLRLELEGELAQSAAYDVAATRLSCALCALQEAHEVGGEHDW